MDDYRGFIKRGFLNAVGRMPDYKIILNSAGWVDKGVLYKSDLEEIQKALDAKNMANGIIYSTTPSPAIPIQTEDTTEDASKEVTEEITEESTTEEAKEDDLENE